jgi:hypothetical protein
LSLFHGGSCLASTRISLWELLGGCEQKDVTLLHTAVEDVHPLQFRYVFISRRLGWNATARSVEDIHPQKVKDRKLENGCNAIARTIEDVRQIYGR